MCVCIHNHANTHGKYRKIIICEHMYRKKTHCSYMFHFYTLNNCSCCHIKCFYLCSSTLTWMEVCVYFIRFFSLLLLLLYSFSLLAFVRIPCTHRRAYERIHTYQFKNNQANNSCMKLFIHCALQSLSISSAVASRVCSLLCVFFLSFNTYIMCPC